MVPLFLHEINKNESYTFKDILLEPDKSDFVISTIKEVEEQKAINHWTLMKNSEVNNKHKNEDGKLDDIISIWYFNRMIFPDGIFMKHKSRLCAHGGMQQ